MDEEVIEAEVVALGEEAVHLKKTELKNLQALRNRLMTLIRCYHKKINSLTIGCLKTTFL